MIFPSNILNIMQREPDGTFQPSLSKDSYCPGVTIALCCHTNNNKRKKYFDEYSESSAHKYKNFNQDVISNAPVKTLRNIYSTLKENKNHVLPDNFSPCDSDGTVDLTETSVRKQLSGDELQFSDEKIVINHEEKHDWDSVINALNDDGEDLGYISCTESLCPTENLDSEHQSSNHDIFAFTVDNANGKIDRASNENTKKIKIRTDLSDYCDIDEFDVISKKRTGSWLPYDEDQIIDVEFKIGTDPSKLSDKVGIMSNKRGKTLLNLQNMERKSALFGKYSTDCMLNQNEKVESLNSSCAVETTQSQDDHTTNLELHHGNDLELKNNPYILPPESDDDDLATFCNQFLVEELA